MANELIEVILNDRSKTISTVVNAIGATVIDSPKGGSTPVYFSPKQRNRIIEMYGIPDTGNEAIDEIMAFNDEFPIWVSSPSLGGKYGGVFVTKTGTIPFNGGASTKAIDFTEVENTEGFTQTPDGLITNFTKTVANFADYVHQSIGITVDGVALVLAASDAEPEIITSTPDVGEGTYTRATGVFSFTFDTAPTDEVLAITYKTDLSSKAYCAVFNKNSQVDDFSLKVASVVGYAGRFSFSLYKKNWETNAYQLLSSFPQIGSIVNNDKNGYNQNIYFPVLFQNSDYIEVKVNTALTYTTFTNDTSAILFSGGIRGTTALTQLTSGWNYFQNKELYPADIFFDTTADAGIPALFNTLSNSYQKYSSYILPLPLADVATAISGSTSVMTNNKSLSFYWNWGKILNSYTGAYIASPLTGRIALRYAAMYDVFNGLAPAWYNENGTHGGQISGVSELFYSADETQEQLLEDARINPIVNHTTFGVVMTRERNSQTLDSDLASVGHTRLYLFYIKNILNQVLPYQLYKLNDSIHRANVKSAIEKIISPTLANPYNLLREFEVKCDEENNNDEVLAREEFVVSVAIKFTPFGKRIKLFFNITDQGVSVTDNL